MPKYTMGPDDDYASGRAEDELPSIPKKPIGPYRGRTEIHNAVPQPGTQEAPNSPMVVSKERSVKEPEEAKRPTMQWPVASTFDTGESEEIIVIDDSEIEEKSGLKKIPVDDKPQITRIPRVPETPQVLEFQHTPQAPQTSTTPEQVSHRIRNAVMVIAVAGLGYGGYKGYERFFAQGNDDSLRDWPSIKDGNVKDKKKSDTVSGEIEVLYVDMKQAEVKLDPVKEPSIIVMPDPQPVVTQGSGNVTRCISGCDSTRTFRGTCENRSES